MGGWLKVSRGCFFSDEVTGAAGLPAEGEVQKGETGTHVTSTHLAEVFVFVFEFNLVGIFMFHLIILKIFK